MVTCINNLGMTGTKAAPQVPSGVCEHEPMVLQLHTLKQEVIEELDITCRHTLRHGMHKSTHEGNEADGKREGNTTERDHDLVIFRLQQTTDG